MSNSEFGIRNSELAKDAVGRVDIVLSLLKRPSVLKSFSSLPGDFLARKLCWNPLRLSESRLTQWLR